MKNNIISIILGVVGLVLFQVLILNNVNLFGYMNPYVYFMFILTLPPKTSILRLMIYSLILGLSIDLFENSGGIHASASVFLGFIRPSLLRLIATKGGEEFGELNLKRMGANKFFLYLVFGILFHHLWLFTLESFKFNDLPLVLLRTLLSGFFSLIIIFILQLFFYKKK